MILSCSGGSNVGQLANQAAVELTQEGFGKMFCLSGVGGHLGGFVQSAEDLPEMVAIDGCDFGCARAILEHAEVPLKSYLVVTELGIEKHKDFDHSRSRIEQVKKSGKGNRSERNGKNPARPKPNARLFLLRVRALPRNERKLNE